MANFVSFIPLLSSPHPSYLMHISDIVLLYQYVYQYVL